MIKIENLKKYFATKVAVDNLNLEVPNGVVYGFLGPNGAGKTTTIKMMVGMLKQDQGKLIAEGTLEEIRAAAKDSGSLEKIFLEYLAWL